MNDMMNLNYKFSLVYVKETSMDPVPLTLLRYSFIESCVGLVFFILRSASIPFFCFFKLHLLLFTGQNRDLG